MYRISSASPSPNASTGPYIKEDMTVKTVYNEGTENEYTEERDYRKGEWVDSVVASEMYKYTVENGLVKDMDGNEILYGKKDFKNPSIVIKSARLLNNE